ncbi:gephyrin-like molybdotransferase receptor GlpR [Actinokineospora terrae]|uniref:Uncharacterized protein n=1 Tax=Actinokineospora terrae TaxID=155974 RepID=A0A1H9UMA9_9PSEU|nr:gephyrin-like molybdotransferase receptor GlpR [Actinokineospora terrae]SES10143.1 hypothetical protein SAMN04487818_107324 [Actinokineospora terrae]
MPSSLIVVGLVVAWLVVLVPMVVRKRQEIARTTDTALAARVVRSGSHSADTPEETAVDDPGDDDALDTLDELDDEPDEEPAEPRRYRPGRGGYDPEAAAHAARAKYAFRQRVVVLMLLAAIGTGVAAGVFEPLLWWLHGVVDLTLVAYLSYLRRQVRIEQEIRERRAARMTGTPRRSHARPAEDDHIVTIPTRSIHPGAIVVELDDEDPWFDELGETGHHYTYRRAVGE